ncbi:MAG: helix-turn-helix domain-containing protein [Deltaproteobacteria bacterium]|nr:helix-turn-helix domain-containing protein [Deltaproteobacteria bacterium]
MSESLYSTSEVARLFNINRVTVYRWVREGVVTAFKVGKPLKIPFSEVERLWTKFGFPGETSGDVFDHGNCKQFHAADKAATKHDRQKLVMAVEADEDGINFIQETFKTTNLNDACKLVTFKDTLDAALAIGKEKPDLLLVRVAASNGHSGEFVKKIMNIHPDIKIIFMTALPKMVDVDEKNIKECRVYLSMPVAKTRLHREITEALGLNRADGSDGVRKKYPTARPPGKSPGSYQKKGGEMRSVS